jgi:hypothetical protein
VAAMKLTVWDVVNVVLVVLGLAFFCARWPW